MSEICTKIDAPDKIESKTDQEGRGEVLFIGGPTLKLIDRYCTRAEIQSGALFRHIRRGGSCPKREAHHRLGSADYPSPCPKLWVLKDSSVVIRSGSAALSRSPKQGLRLLICRMQAGGSRHRCRRTMPKRSWQERGAVARFFYGKGTG